RFRNAFSQIDVQLKRRYELIPNLVETVKGYLEHEQQTLTAVIEARNAASAANDRAQSSSADPAAMQQLMAAENSLLAGLGQLMMLREDYPDLKADQQTSRLMEELVSTENKVAFARQHYNDSVMTYNAYRQSIPPVLIAGPAGFTAAIPFEISDSAERAVQKVDLG
ncbi:MAG: LemA family protein, partial [Planctomycetota bacterium]